MREDNLLDILCRERIGGALEASLKNCDRYNKAENEANKKMEKALRIGLSKKQKFALDQALMAYNHSNAEYGREAYIQGFRDGARFIAEIFDNGHV
jgi:hypothetical protein